MKVDSHTPVFLSNKIDELCALKEEYPLKSEIPDNIMIELTNICNLRCKMCHNRDMHRKKGFMSPGLFKKIIDQASELNIQNVGLYTVGESFLHPKILDFIKYTKQKGMKYVYITTNGQVLDNKKIEGIFDSGLDSIKFSIDAGTKSSYESIRKGAKWERLIDTIRKIRVLRDKKRSKLKIFASYLMMKSNFDEILNFNRTFGELLDESMYSFIYNLGGNVDVSDMLSVSLKEFWHPCPLLWNRFIVNYEGKLTICCVDFEARLIYGDLKTETLKDCWNNKTMMQLRRIHKNMEFDKLPVCYRCDEIKMSPERDKILTRLVKGMLDEV